MECSKIKGIQIGETGMDFRTSGSIPNQRDPIDKNPIQEITNRVDT